jgi:hypothetical protein
MRNSSEHTPDAALAGDGQAALSVAYGTLFIQVGVPVVEGGLFAKANYASLDLIPLLTRPTLRFATWVTPADQCSTPDCLVEPWR